MSLENTQHILKSYVPGGLFGYDKKGRPVFFEPMGRVDFIGLLHTVRKEDIVAYKRKFCQNIKDIALQRMKEGSQPSGRYCTLIIDAAGANKKHLWPPGIDCYKAMVQMYDIEFPELPEKIIVINTPKIFPILYAIVKVFVSQDIRDRIQVMGLNWKEEISNFVDNDNLPEFYGGNGKDENGDPQCQQFICYGGKLPTSLYVNRNVKTEEFEHVNIASGKNFKKICEIESPKSIQYEFMTADLNIGFSVNYIAADGAVEEVLAPKRCDSHLSMQRGYLKCDKPGDYVFTFDNSFSRLRKKSLFYKICVKSSQDESANRNTVKD